jgi:type IV fimbrial biogenesis protein FimT
MLLFSKSSRVVHAGFSMTEVLVTLTLVGVVATIVIPPMLDVFLNTRLTVHVNDWLAANRFARAEAIKRGRLVTICRSAHADTGHTACDTGAVENWKANDWATGWVIFVESPDGDIGQIDDGDEVLMRQPPLPQKVRAPSTLKKISYTPMGEPIGRIAGMNIRFDYDGSHKRVVCMARTGRTRVVLGRSSCD